MIHKLEIRGKQYPVRISYYAIKHTSIDTGVSLDDIKSLGIESGVFEKFLYYGLIAGCNMENVEMPFKEDEMELILDEVFFKFTEIIKESFSKIAVEEENKGMEVKKK